MSKLDSTVKYEVPLADRAVPYFMIALARANKIAAGRVEKALDFAPIAGTHLLTAGDGQGGVEHRADVYGGFLAVPDCAFEVVVFDDLFHVEFDKIRGHVLDLAYQVVNCIRFQSKAGYVGFRYIPNSGFTILGEVDLQLYGARIRTEHSMPQSRERPICRNGLSWVMMDRTDMHGVDGTSLGDNVESLSHKRALI